MPLAAAKQSSSILHRLLHPLAGTDCISFANERAQVSRFIHGIADPQSAHAFEKQIGELLKYRTLNQNALDRDAGLAGVAESASNAAFRSPCKVGVAVDDYASVAAEFKHNFFLSRAALDLPPNRCAARKTDHLYTVVGNQKSGVFVGKRQHVESPIGQARLFNRLGQKKRTERSLRRWLQNNRAAACNRRSDLVGHEIQGKIKWSNSGNRSQRKPAHNSPATRGELLPIKRQVFPRYARGLFGANGKGENGAVNFGAGGLQRLAGLLRHGACEFLFM